VTLAEFVQEWLVRLRRSKPRAETLRRYESLWDRHVLLNPGGVELRQLRSAVLDRFLAKLSATASRRLA
jgi:hypothetical protein